MTEPTPRNNALPPIASDELRAQVMTQTQGALSLFVAFIGSYSQMLCMPV